MRRVDLVAPEIFETRWRQLGITHGVLDILVSEIVLDRSLITGGVRCSRSCPASDHLWIRRQSASAACCRSAQRSLPSLPPTMIVMGVVGVALGGGWPSLVAAQFMSIYGSRAREPTRARRRCPEQTERSPASCRPTANRPCWQEREQRTPPVSKESSPCFLSVIAFWRNYLSR
jgi:hypothetical protein